MEGGLHQCSDKSLFPIRNRNGCDFVLTKKVRKEAAESVMPVDI